MRRVTGKTWMVGSAGLVVGLILGAQGLQAEPPAAQPGAYQKYDELDTRQAVQMPPMMALHHKQQMQDHLKVVQEMVQAMKTDDFKAVEKAASRIASSEESSQQCSMMGRSNPNYVAQAETFHKTADSIVAAARAKDRAKVMGALGETMTLCVSCHSTFKQQLVMGGMGGGMGQGGGHEGHGMGQGQGMKQADGKGPHGDGKNGEGCGASCACKH